MGVLEEMLAELQGIRAALAGGASAPADKPKTAPKKAADKGPTLEQVQSKISELATKGDAVKVKIKAAIVELGGKRAGDFEGDADKLKKLDAALDAIQEELDAPAAEEDEDLL